MRRGLEGHVAVPRGPTRRLRDVLFIFIYIGYNMEFYDLKSMDQRK